MFNAVDTQIKESVDSKRGVGMCGNFDARGVCGGYDGSELGAIKGGDGVSGERWSDFGEARARRVI